MILGTNIFCSIGNMEITRTPDIVLNYARHKVKAQAVITLPNHKNELKNAFSLEDTCFISFGYRGDNSLLHTFEGTVAKINYRQKDSIEISCTGLENQLFTTLVKECFYDEPAHVVAKRLLQKSGLSVGFIDIPSVVLPYQSFNTLSVYKAIQQLVNTLTKSYQIDLSEHCLYLDRNNAFSWTEKEENTEAFIIASCENLIEHFPMQDKNKMGKIVCSLLPSLKQNQPFSLYDSTKEMNFQGRTQEVVHHLSAKQNTTTIYYGKTIHGGNDVNVGRN